MLGDGAGVHESLGDDGEHGVHVLGRLDVKDELWVLDDVDPEAQRQTEGTGGQACVYTQLSQQRCHVTPNPNPKPNPSLTLTLTLTVPVGLPDVDGLRVRDAMLSRLLVQQIEEVFHGQWDRTAGAEDDGEQVIHKLLQRSLESTEEPLDLGL